jgi:dTDP-4-amino-4,6-dideoxygalactose transaminase
MAVEPSVMRGHRYTIPFNQPTRTANDTAYIQEALAGSHLSGDGPFTGRCHEMLEKLMGVPKALLTTSCTHALEMAAFLLDVKPGDEVIVPSFTFVSSVNAFVIRGARPIFADVRPDTFCIDERHAERLISERTRAIVAVHYAGVVCSAASTVASWEPLDGWRRSASMKPRTLLVAREAPF